MLYMCVCRLCIVSILYTEPHVLLQKYQTAIHIKITVQLNLGISQAARLVYNSLWTSIGTISVHLNGKPWGNVRSVADGVGANSTGLPVFLKCVYACMWIYVCGACACVCIVCACACACVFLSRCVRACVFARTCVRVRAYVVDIYMWILKYAHKQ